MKKLLINQPGKVGDILICLPIAKYYSKEYKVDWLCSSEYHSLFRNINYCKPITTIITEYDKVIDLSFGIVINTLIHEWWINNRESFDSFVSAKYRLADVPLSVRWNLSWQRNIAKENSLYDLIIRKYGDDYNIVHERSGNRFAVEISVENKVSFEPIEDYNIFDWFKVLKKAKEIHCIDSSLCNFVEIIPLKISKFYYDNPTDPGWNKTIISNDWRIV